MKTVVQTVAPVAAYAAPVAATVAPVAPVAANFSGLFSGSMIAAKFDENIVNCAKHRKAIHPDFAALALSAHGLIVPTGKGFDKFSREFITEETRNFKGLGIRNTSGYRVAFSTLRELMGLAPVAAYAAPVAATVAPVAPVAATVAPVAPVAPVAATVAPVALSALETIKASIVREALTNDDLNAIISLCIQEQARLATTKG